MGLLVKHAIFFQIFTADTIETVNVHEIVLESVRLSGYKVVFVVRWPVTGEFSVALGKLKVVPLI